MAAVPLPSESAPLLELREGLGLGGGRGVYSRVSLLGGQLLLQETPLVFVPADKAPDVGVLRARAACAWQCCMGGCMHARRMGHASQGGD
jgi:hypothetical protein